VNTPYHIRYVKRADIDISRWDQCIEESYNGLIYAYSFYLDHMSRHWDALLLNDYEAVMPITWNRKWGISYLYQPAFTQRLGIFSRQAPDAGLIELFAHEIKKRFYFTEIFLHEASPFPGSEKRANYVLSLQPAYQTIRGEYKDRMNRGLRTAAKNDMLCRDTVDYGEIIAAFRSQYGSRIPQIGNRDYQSFMQLCETAKSKGMLLGKKVSTADGKPLAWGVFLKDKKRIYNIMPITTALGRTREAGRFLMDQLIREFANHPLLLDFEGSDIPGVATFYQEFGAVNQPYFFFRYNQLPFPMRFLKKK